MTNAKNTLYAGSMIVSKIFSLLTLQLFAFQFLCAQLLREQFQQAGYVEIYKEKPATISFDTLYARFDEFVNFLRINPVWAQKLYGAKERFLRSKDKKYYSTDFFGFYDESEREGRNQKNR